MFQALGCTVRDTLRETGRIFLGLWQQPGFYKFIAFLSFAAFIKMIFLHMDYTYPKFGIRELGEGSPIGHLYALNSILIVFLAPLVGVLTQRIPAYRMVIFGSFVAASSVFIMTVPSQRFRRLADGKVGHAIANSWLGEHRNSSSHLYQVIRETRGLNYGDYSYIECFPGGALPPASMKCW